MDLASALVDILLNHETFCLRLQGQASTVCNMDLNFQPRHTGEIGNHVCCKPALFCRGIDRTGERGNETRGW